MVKHFHQYLLKGEVFSIDYEDSGSGERVNEKSVSKFTVTCQNKSVAPPNLNHQIQIGGLWLTTHSIPLI
jgi:hypothetical protein